MVGMGPDKVKVKVCCISKLWCSLLSALLFYCNLYSPKFPLLCLTVSDWLFWKNHLGVFGIQELLKHCSHRSASFRLKSLVELCSRILSASVDVAPHVAILLDAVGALFIDDERKVRSEARKLLKIVIDACKCVKSDVSPFFPLMTSRLCCAMTHVHEDIR